MRSITSLLALPAFMVPVFGCGDSGSTTTTLPDASLEVRQQLEQLNSPDPQRRVSAAVLLGQMGHEAAAAVPRLLKAFKDKNRQVRIRVAEALGRIGDLRAVETLVQTLETKDDDWEVRSRIAEALGQLKDPRATDSLVASLADMVSHVRYRAAIALGELGGPAAQEALASAARLDSDMTVRFVATESLQRMGSVERDQGDPPQGMDEDWAKDRKTDERL